MIDRHAALFVAGHRGDLSDGSNISRLVERFALSEIYYLGAQSRVKLSFDAPECTGDNGLP